MVFMITLTLIESSRNCYHDTLGYITLTEEVSNKTSACIILQCTFLGLILIVYMIIQGECIHTYQEIRPGNRECGKDVLLPRGSPKAKKKELNITLCMRLRFINKSRSPPSGLSYKDHHSFYHTFCDFMRWKNK